MNSKKIIILLFSLLSYTGISFSSENNKLLIAKLSPISKNIDLNNQKITTLNPHISISPEIMILLTNNNQEAVKVSPESLDILIEEWKQTKENKPSLRHASVEEYQGFLEIPQPCPQDLLKLYNAYKSPEKVLADLPNPQTTKETQPENTKNLNPNNNQSYYLIFGTGLCFSTILILLLKYHYKIT